MDEINQRAKKIDKDLRVPQLSENARYIAETRYAIKNEVGQSTEKVEDIFWRVASSVARGDKKSETEMDKTARAFYEVMAEQKFCQIHLVL